MYLRKKSWVSRRKYGSLSRNLLKARSDTKWVVGFLARKSRAARERFRPPGRFERVLAHHDRTRNRLLEVVHELNEDDSAVRVAVFVCGLALVFPDRHAGIGYRFEGYIGACRREVVELEHPFKVVLVPLVAEGVQVHEVGDFGGLDAYVDTGK